MDRRPASSAPDPTAPPSGVPAAQDAAGVGRGRPVRATRRRPTHRKGRPTLTRERIAEAGLEVIRSEGHHALTMRALADRLEVSPRALYNYVSDRQEVLGLAMYQAQSAWPEAQLDPAHWQRDLRTFCRNLRSWYRTYPGLIGAAMSEDLVNFVHPGAIRNNEELLALLLDVGLTAESADAAHMHVVISIAGFTQWFDAPDDHSQLPGVTAAQRLPTAPEVLRHFETEELPALRSQSDLAARPSADDRFEAVLDLLIAAIDAFRPGGPRSAE